MKDFLSTTEGRRTGLMKERRGPLYGPRRSFTPIPNRLQAERAKTAKYTIDWRFDWKFESYPCRSLPFGAEHGSDLFVAQRKSIEPFIKILHRPVHVDILEELRMVLLGHPQQHQGGVGAGDVPAVHPQWKFADRLLLHGLDGSPVVTGHPVAVEVVRQEREEVGNSLDRKSVV